MKAIPCSASSVKRRRERALLDRGLPGVVAQRLDYPRFGLGPERFILEVGRIEAELQLLRRLLAEKRQLDRLRHGGQRLARPAHRVANLLLDLEQAAGLARQLHLLPDVAQQVAQHGRPQVAHELAQQVVLARHRFGADDVDLFDPWPLPHLDPHLSPCALRSQPQRQRGDLHGARVDVDAVQVVLQDQAGALAGGRRHGPGIPAAAPAPGRDRRTPPRR